MISKYTFWGNFLVHYDNIDLEQTNVILVERNCDRVALKIVVVQVKPVQWIFTFILMREKPLNKCVYLKIIRWGKTYFLRLYIYISTWFSICTLNYIYDLYITAVLGYHHHWILQEHHSSVRTNRIYVYYCSWGWQLCKIDD